MKTTPWIAALFAAWMGASAVANPIEPPFFVPCRLASQPDPVEEKIDAPYSSMVEAASRAHGVEVRLVHAVIWAESSYDAKAVSASGAEGLMQLMPATARRYGVRDSFDPRQNIDGGVKHLKDLLEQFDGDLELAVAAYNAGAYAVVRAGNRIPNYPQTAAYVPKVIAYYHRLEARVERP